MPDTTKVKIIALTSPDGTEIPCDIDVNRWEKAFGADNFIWNELCDRNTLTLKFSPELLRVVQWVRTNYGWIVDNVEGLSWYRSFETNQRIGGDPKSPHLKGLAVDIKCWYDRVYGKQVNPIHVAYAFQQAFIANGLKGGIGTYYKGYDKTDTNGYNHIDIRTYNNLYVCYNLGTLLRIDTLDELKIW